MKTEKATKYQDQLSLVASFPNCQVIASVFSFDSIYSSIIVSLSPQLFQLYYIVSETGKNGERWEPNTSAPSVLWIYILRLNREHVQNYQEMDDNSLF